MKNDFNDVNYNQKIKYWNSKIIWVLYSNKMNIILKKHDNKTWT